MSQQIAETGQDDSDEFVPVAFRPGQIRKWWHNHLAPEERQRVMSELAIRKDEHWGIRFGIMLTFSVIVAVMGLSVDSAAIVIGAMLLAPLMQPVLATAANISMGLYRKALGAFARVAIASIWSIALAFVLSAIFVRGDLAGEVTSRTAPDIRDLVVALCAGAAGAYATVRTDVSSSLPGVAVAVALVPPLGVAGIALEAGNGTFTRGALLLYTTNLAAIILAGFVVFVVTGFVPPRRLATTFRRTALVAAGVVIALAAITVPLYRASTSAIEASDQQIKALEIVENWLGTVETTRTPDVSFDGDRILVEVRSFQSPPDADPLRAALQDEFGQGVAVSVDWVRLEQATTTTTLPPTTTIVTDEERLLSEVGAIVAQWLGDQADSARVESLTIDDGVVRIDASGVGDAPSVASLTERLDAEIDRTLEVRLTWLERRDVTSEPEPTPTELLALQIGDLADAWARDNDVVVTAVGFDGEQAIVEIAGLEAPDATDLVRDVDELIGTDGATTVLFSVRLDITTTSTTTTTTTIAPSVPTTTP